MINPAKIIYQAIVAHIAWKKHLRDIINTGQSEYDVNPDHCDFGHWLNENADKLSLYEHYSEVVNLHKRFHKEAEKIIQLVLNNKRQDAELAVAYGEEFDHLSQELVKNLLAWHEIVNKSGIRL